MLAVISLDAQTKANRNAQIALNSATNTELGDMVGRKFSEFIGNPYCQVTRLELESSHSIGYLRIALNERFGNGFVLGIDLEKGEEIIIQGTTLSGAIIELARITADGPILGHGFNIDQSLVKGMTVTAVDAKPANAGFNFQTNKFLYFAETSQKRLPCDAHTVGELKPSTRRWVRVSTFQDFHSSKTVRHDYRCNFNDP